MHTINLPPSEDPLFLALNQALGHKRMSSVQRRLAQCRDNGLLGQDSKRPKSWEAFGWAESLDFTNYYRLWERGGLAHGAVSRVISKCWQDEPEVIEGEPEETKRPPTPWEKEFKKFAKASKLWEVFREADKRRVIGHYSAIILQIADGKQWQQPVNKRGAKRLVKMIPVWEGQLTVSDWGVDETQEDYGQPKMYSFQEKAVTNLDSSESAASYAGRDVQVHPDRVIILGDILDGVPMLRAAFNDFVNIEKILGGSGESFLKNASRQVAINFDAEVDLEDIAAAHKVKLSDLSTLYDSVTAGLNRGIDQTLITQGATVQPITTTVPDPQQHFNISLQSAAASIMLPVMIWIGSQTGERSSTEDQKDWNNTCQGRRVQVLSSDIETLVAHLMRIGLVRSLPETSVSWSKLNESTQKEKLENSELMGKVNALFAPTGEFPFDAAEARDVAGFENGGTLDVPLPEDDGESNDPNQKPGQQNK